jgi:hypothetical protein
MTTKAMLKKADFFMYTGFDYLFRFTRKSNGRGSTKRDCSRLWRRYVIF